MPGLKKFMLGGLDLKSNDLVRDQLRSSAMRNITKTQKGDLDKRNGYELVETAAFELEESCYFKSLDQDVFVKSDGTIWKPYLATRKNCSIASLFANAGLTVKNRIITAEYLGSLYFTTSDGKSPVVKYDGGDAYLAGLPAPTKVYAGTDSTISGGAGTYFYRVFYSFKDLNGNIIYGPYKQFDNLTSGQTLTVSTFKAGNPYGKFYNKYLTIPIGNQTLSSASNTLNYTTTNYVVGDKFLMDTEIVTLVPDITETVLGIKNRVLTITNIAAGVITFLPADFDGASFLLTGAGYTNLDRRLRMNIFESPQPSFGYHRTDASDNTGRPVTNINNDDAFGTSSSPTGQQPFEDIYNEDGQKLRPPLCKYLAPYGDQLVFGNIIGVWDQENNFVQYNNDDLVIPSDFGLADNGENHSANIQKIGESYDGSVTGLSRCNDLMVVTKDNSIYALDGILEPGGYNLRKIPTNYIGCKSHNSILQTEGGLMFHGNDGLYFTDGSSCQKMSLLIDPFFNTIDSTLTKSTVNSLNKKFLFYMTDNVTHYCVAYDYEFKEWFIWDSLDMSHGIYEKNSKIVHFAKAALLNKFNTGYSDAGVAISAYYKANWEDLKNPSLDKKFKYIRIWNLTSVASSFNLKIQKDWIDTDTDTIACTIAAYGTHQQGHDQKTIKSIRYIFENNTINQGMMISAYELQYEVIQALDKGEG